MWSCRPVGNGLAMRGVVSCHRGLDVPAVFDELIAMLFLTRNDGLSMLVSTVVMKGIAA